MLSIYTTEKKLVELYHSLGNDWQQIVCNYAKIIVSKSVPASESNCSDQILRILHRQQRLRYESNYIDNIPNNPISVLENRNAVFILEVKQEEAMKISQDYGVLCFSSSALPPNPLIIPGWTIDTGDPFFNNRWDKILANLDVPSNYLILTDRYLFSSEKNKADHRLNETIMDSYENVYEILDAVMPQNITSDSFQVAIFCDASLVRDTDDKGNTLSFPELAAKVWKIKKRLKRQYRFCIELISIDSNNSAYKETHDRKILSNYFIVTASHKLKAFRNGESLDAQYISYKYLFSEGTEPGSRSTIPESSHARTIEMLKYAIKHLSGSELYAYNGAVETMNIKNRILR